MSTDIGRSESLCSKFDLFSSSCHHVWRLKASSKAMKRIFSPDPSSGATNDLKTLRERFLGILNLLKMGRFPSSRINRPYRGDSEAHTLLFAAKVARDVVIVFTIHATDDCKEQVLFFIDVVEPAQVESIWRQFKEEISELPRDALKERCSFFCPDKKRTFPARLKEGFSTLWSHRFDEDSSRVYDITDNRLLKTFVCRRHSNFSFAIPYELDRHQRSAVEAIGNVVIVGRGGTGKTSVLANRLFTAYRHAIELGVDPPRQLFVSQNSKLVEVVKEEFRDLVQTYRKTRGESVDLGNFEENTRSRFRSFFKLTEYLDQELPQDGGERLFYNEADEERKRRARLRSGYHSRGSFSSRSQVFRKEEVVGFDSFQQTYFDRVASHDLRGSFSAAFLFTEFMSSLKQPSLDSSSSSAVLSLKEYQQLESSPNGILISRKDRKMIYKSFKRYERLRVENRHIDIVGVMVNLCSRMSRVKVPFTTTFDTVFVDEVQDLMPYQWRLFDLLRDRNTTFVCCGDQAQAIAAGANFRFSTLKHFMYASRSMAVAPQVIQLTVNYRTSESILRLANRIIALIRFFFPTEVSALHHESVGAKHFEVVPCMFAETADPLMKLFGEESTRLSSDQVILVRHKDESEKLKKRMKARGQWAMVLTILEAKGLEFADVFVINAFSSVFDSKNRMRVLKRFSQRDPEPGSIPEFDELKHAHLCHWLKELYVAVTRAKQRVFFFDENIEERELVAEAFQDCLKLSSTDEHEFLRKDSSASTGWDERADTFKQRGMFTEAQEAFKCAGNGTKAAEMKALQLLRQCKANRSDSKIAEKAASLLHSIGQTRKAADVLRDVGFAVRAAELYEELQLVELAVDTLWEAKRYAELYSATKRLKASLTPDLQRCIFWEVASELYTAKHRIAFESLQELAKNEPDDVLDWLEKKAKSKNANSKPVCVGKPTGVFNDLVRFYKTTNQLNRGQEFFADEKKLNCIELLLGSYPIAEEFESVCYENRFDIARQRLPSLLSKAIKISKAMIEADKYHLLRDVCESALEEFSSESALVPEASQALLYVASRSPTIGQEQTPKEAMQVREKSSRSNPFCEDKAFAQFACGINSFIIVQGFLSLKKPTGLGVLERLEAFEESCGCAVADTYLRQWKSSIVKEMKARLPLRNLEGLGAFERLVDVLEQSYLESTNRGTPMRSWKLSVDMAMMINILSGRKRIIDAFHLKKSRTNRLRSDLIDRYSSDFAGMDDRRFLRQYPLDVLSRSRSNDFLYFNKLHTSKNSPSIDLLESRIRSRLGELKYKLSVEDKCRDNVPAIEIEVIFLRAIYAEFDKYATTNSEKKKACQRRLGSLENSLEQLLKSELTELGETPVDETVNVEIKQRDNPETVQAPDDIKMDVTEEELLCIVQDKLDMMLNMVEKMASRESFMFQICNIEQSIQDQRDEMEQVDRILEFARQHGSQQGLRFFSELELFGAIDSLAHLKGSSLS